MRFMFAATIVALVAGGTAVAQDRNDQVQRDARGVPVISAPPNVPPGVNQPLPMTLPPQAQVVPSDAAIVFRTRPADEDYPRCTRERTDNCIQAYSNPRGGRR